MSLEYAVTSAPPKVIGKKDARRKVYVLAANMPNEPNAKKELEELDVKTYSEHLTLAALNPRFPRTTRDTLQEIVLNIGPIPSVVNQAYKVYCRPLNASQAILAQEFMVSLGRGAIHYLATYNGSKESRTLIEMIETRYRR